MYPLTCYAGFPMPLKAGKFEIAGYSCAADDTTLAMELAIVDDNTIMPSDTFGKLLDNADDYKFKIVHRKAAITYGNQLKEQFSFPIKTRYGISISSTNIRGGSLCVYVR